MSPSIWQILIVVLLVVVLFGRGKISSLMGDVAKGIKSFKRGMADDSEETAAAGDAERDRKTDRVASEGMGRDRPMDRTIDVTPEPRKDEA